MARYGARNIFWAPVKANTQDTDPNKLPVYDEPRPCGQLNKFTDSPNFIEGTMPGDDQIVLHETNFKDGTAAMENVFIPMKDAADMLGAAYDEENGMAHGADDKPPYIGKGFITCHLGKEGTYWQAVFYPLLKAKPAGSDYATRNQDINFATDKMEYSWHRPACGKYKIIKDFATEAEANTYIQGLFKGTAAVPGLPKPAAG